ncbi:hypothetical protein SUGI_0996250 [Cryptomeria japonica]|nr:hypothetical protein SUGI_0996250 [Cryptomeria japonica]
MEFHPLKFGFLCTILLVRVRVLGVGGHSGMPSTLRKNRLLGIFLKKLRCSQITNSYASTTILASYEEHNYTQILDHFGYTPESYQTFPQIYFVDKSNWGGAQN